MDESELLTLQTASIAETSQNTHRTELILASLLGRSAAPYFVLNSAAHTLVSALGELLGECFSVALTLHTRLSAGQLALTEPTPSSASAPLP